MSLVRTVTLLSISRAFPSCALSYRFIAIQMSALVLQLKGACMLPARTLDDLQDLPFRKHRPSGSVVALYLRPEFLLQGSNTLRSVHSFSILAVSTPVA